MATVKDVIYEDATLLKFSWKYNKSANTTAFFMIHKISNCSLTLNVTNSNSGGYQFKIDLTLEFNEINSLSISTDTIKINIRFGQSTQGHVFQLTKIDDTNFTASSYIYEPEVYNKSEYFVHAQLHLPKQNDFSLEMMNRIFSEEIFSDLKLVVGDKVFNVHKNILSTRNDVLAKMILSDMVEKKTNTIDFSNWTDKVVEEMLKYIYTGECNVSKHSHELFELAHFLQDSELQHLCEVYLKSNINIKNLLETMELTKHTQYNLDDLLKIVNKFITDNKSILADDLDYIEYCIDNISLGNVMMLLEFSEEYKINNLFEAAVKYVCNNHKKILENVECKSFLTSRPTLMWNLYKHSVITLHSMCDQKIEN